MTFTGSIETSSRRDISCSAEFPDATDPALITGSVYLAFPLHTYGSARARRLIKLAQRRFLNAEVLPACDQFTSNVDWLSQWPELLPTLSAVCVFGDEPGWIGKGVWDELYDALALGLPVFVLTNKALHPWSEVGLIESDGRNWRRYARLHVGSSKAGDKNA